MNLKIIQATDRIENVSSEVIDKLYQLAYEDQSIGLASQITSGENDIVGYIRSTAAYQDAVEYLRVKFPNLTIDIPNNNYYIRFEDPVVEQLCITNFSSDGHGVSLQDAANQTTVGRIFTQNTSITKFNEFKYFTRVANVANAFQGCTSLEEITMAPGIEYKWSGNNSPFESCRSLVTVNWNGAQIYSGDSNQKYTFRDVGANRLTGLRWYDGLIPVQQKFPDSVFTSCRNLGKLLFPEGVESVMETYQGCESLQYIEYPTTLTQIGTFTNTLRDGYSGGAVIVFKSTTPPTLRSDSSTPSSLEYARNFTIYVPNGSILDYQSAPYPWTLVTSKIRPIRDLSSTFVAMGTITQADIDAPLQQGYTT